MGFLGISGKTWKKIGKIALKAAPIVAAPFTGGASLLAIGAGAGAASGALGGGGWKGALIGGGLGAIPGGGGAGSALTGGAKNIATGLTKGAATNFATGTATGLATGQGLSRSLAGGGMGALSGFGTTGAGGFGQAAKTIGKGTALNVGGAYASRGLQAAGVPGVVANQGGNVFSNYLGKQMTPTSSLPDNPYDLWGGNGPASSSPGISSYLPQGGSSNFWPSGGGGGTSTGGGGSTDGGTAPPSWSERWGPILAQAGGLAVGAVVGKKATSMAQARSPEEQAALRGAQGAAGTAGQAGGQLVRQGQDYLQKPGQYFQTLLGGNRAAMSQAVAGPTAQLTGIYRGAERNLNQQGIRGAARDVAAGDLNRERASKLAALTTGVQPYAAEQLASMGNQAVGQGAGLLGTSGNVYSGLLGQGFQNRKYAREEGGNTAAAIGGLARDVGEVAFKRSPGSPSAPKMTTAKKPKATPTLPPGTIGAPGQLPPLGTQGIPGIGPPPPPTTYPLPTPVQGLPSGYPFSTPGDYNPYGNG